MSVRLHVDKTVAMVSASHPLNPQIVKLHFSCSYKSPGVTSIDSGCPLVFWGSVISSVPIKALGSLPLSLAKPFYKGPEVAPVDWLSHLVSCGSVTVSERVLCSGRPAPQSVAPSLWAGVNPAPADGQSGRG